MREIKFMAWHKEKKILREVFEISFSGGYVILAGFCSFGEIEAPIRDVELMQYTGLKDKNGVEIYDGYILELRANPFNRKRDLFQVVFKDGGFRDEWNNYIGQYLPPDIRNKQGERVRLNEACEVVGNIYENKI